MLYAGEKWACYFWEGKGVTWPQCLIPLCRKGSTQGWGQAADMGAHQRPPWVQWGCPKEAAIRFDRQFNNPSPQAHPRASSLTSIGPSPSLGICSHIVASRELQPVNCTQQLVVVVAAAAKSASWAPAVSPLRELSSQLFVVKVTLSK